MSHTIYNSRFGSWDKDDDWQTAIGEYNVRAPRDTGGKCGGSGCGIRGSQRTPKEYIVLPNSNRIECMEGDITNGDVTNGDVTNEVTPVDTTATTSTTTNPVPSSEPAPVPSTEPTTTSVTTRTRTTQIDGTSNGDIDSTRTRTRQTVVVDELGDRGGEEDERYRVRRGRRRRRHGGDYDDWVYDYYVEQPPIIIEVPVGNPMEMERPNVFARCWLRILRIMEKSSTDPSWNWDPLRNGFYSPKYRAQGRFIKGFSGWSWTKIWINSGWSRACAIKLRANS